MLCVPERNGNRRGTEEDADGRPLVRLANVAVEGFEAEFQMGEVLLTTIIAGPIREASQRLFKVRDAVMKRNVLSEVIREADGGDVFPGVNLSDRAEGWEDNYRSPDVAVFLPGNRAEEFESHYRGPADFLIEIVSPSDKSFEKIPFYGFLGVRELLIIDRYPWSLQLYRHNGGELALAAQSSAKDGKI